MRAALALALLPLIACSGTKAPPPVIDTEPGDTGVDGDDTFDVDPPTDDTDPVDTTPPVEPVDCDDPGFVGLAGVCDISVNNASLEIPVDAGDPLWMGVEQSPPTPAGSYYGSGTGNRAIAGFHGYDRKRLDDLSRVELDMEHIVGPFTAPQVIMPELGLIVDLECSGGPYAYVSVTWEHIGAPLELDDDRLRYIVTPEQAKFTATGGLTDPAGTTTLLPDPDVTMGMDPAPLNDVIGAWPDACLRNRDLEDPFLPRDVNPSGFLLTLGRATTLAKSQWKVWRVVIDEDEHLPPM